MKFIDWNAGIKEGRKNDMCPNCFTKNMRRQGRKRRVCRDCGTVFARPVENEQNSRKMEATAAH